LTDSSAATSSVAQKCAPLGCEPLEATRCNFAPVGPRDKRALRKMCSVLDAPENALELARHHVTASQPPTRQTPMRQEDVFQFFGCPSHPPCPISLETSSSVAESAALPTSSSPCGSRQRPLELADAQAMSKSSCTHAHPRGACASTCKCILMSVRMHTGIQQALAQMPKASPASFCSVRGQIDSAPCCVTRVLWAYMHVELVASHYERINVHGLCV
jgi:hypothetical protein